MQTKQKSAAELAAAKPEYLTWLHNLTTLGYADKITIRSDNAEVIALYFLEGKTPEQALEEYKKFLPRWLTLKGKAMNYGRHYGRKMDIKNRQ